ncbi:MAG: RNA polymerase sigma factor [Muribaculaceae bacterium]|nr:RNA polymerase sigma factor [Muribaculaceae bacterium]
MNSKKNSDIDSFEEIVDLYQDRLFRFAFMRVGVREVAEDIVQDVLLRLYRTMSAGKDIQRYEQFLLRSVSNACIDHIRCKKPPSLRLEEIGEIPDIDDQDIDDEFRRISILLDGLPFDQAETVRLKCYDGLTFSQIADLQNLPEATVKSRYRYAIQYIRKKLNQ